MPRYIKPYKIKNMNMPENVMQYIKQYIYIYHNNIWKVYISFVLVNIFFNIY